MSQPAPANSHAGLAPSERVAFARKIENGLIPSSLVEEALAFARTASVGGRRALLRNPSITLAGARHVDERMLSGEGNPGPVEKWGPDVPGYFDRVTRQLAGTEFAIRNLLDLTALLPDNRRRAFLHQLCQLLKACELLIHRIEREHPPLADQVSITR